jgi:hypothetical protein
MYEWHLSQRRYRFFVEGSRSTSYFDLEPSLRGTDLCFRGTSDIGFGGRGVMVNLKEKKSFLVSLYIRKCDFSGTRVAPLPYANLILVPLFIDRTTRELMAE